MFSNEELKRPIHREMSGRFAGLKVKDDGVYGIDDIGNAEEFIFAVINENRPMAVATRLVRKFFTSAGSVVIEYDPIMVRSKQIDEALKKL
ncbi:hypothetical protein pETSU_160 [Edwardsiella phage pEt-SU]|uniref:Uncharacterized protein n=1 Tax=Edwardsiella phage pEt-SU TaxID=2562142 RepID=A0A4D6DWL1_9CAUD|nr:hypothetical protein HOV39_gp160 [Edwardsiella phage pEt-SU]QBZ70741.1 hypothetical protein pETSU_160 [Edwardsiella phage pEt-SU]